MSKLPDQRKVGLENTDCGHHGGEGEIRASRSCFEKFVANHIRGKVGEDTSASEGTTSMDGDIRRRDDFLSAVRRLELGKWSPTWHSSSGSKPICCRTRRPKLGFWVRRRRVGGCRTSVCARGCSASSNVSGEASWVLLRATLVRGKQNHCEVIGI